MNELLGTGIVIDDSTINSINNNLQKRSGIKQRLVFYKNKSTDYLREMHLQVFGIVFIILFFILYFFL